MRKLNILAVSLAVVFFAQPAFSETDAQKQKLIETISRLDWKKEGGNFNLGDSKSTITIDNKYALVLGKDADKFITAINGAEFSGHADAAMIDPQTSQFVIYEYENSGYVKFDDWEKLNNADLLKQISEATEEANKRRAATGTVAIHVSGWKVPPTLDKTTQTVRWVININSDDNHPYNNAVTLLFGRYGYEKITAVGENTDTILDTGRKALTFNTGASYKDFKIGDKVAEYGVATLVGTLIGAKLAKLGLFTFIAVFLKKAIVLILAIPVMIKRFFKKKLGKTPTSIQTYQANTEKPDEDKKL